MKKQEWLEHQANTRRLLQAAGAIDAACPVCQGTKHYALPFVTAPWTTPPGPPFQPEGLFLVPLACAACKHVRLFLASGLAVAGEQLGGGEGEPDE